MLDARAAKLMKPGEHMIMPEAPGLRLSATASGRSWTYRFKSPVDGRMRQIKIGSWPAMPYQRAWTEWENLRRLRDEGIDPSLEKRAEKATKRSDAADKDGRYLVVNACADYIEHLKRTRKERGWREVRRMFDTMVGDALHAEVVGFSRSQAYDLINAHAGTPHQAKKLKAELAGAWDHAIDAGRVPDDTPNWFRQIFRGKLKSVGKVLLGERVQSKRVLSAAEMGQLIHWLNNFPRTTEDVLTLYLWTGTRGAEIVAMHASEISSVADQLWWTIPKAKTKNARRDSAGDVRVPLIGRARAVVLRRREANPGGYLFPSETAVGHMQQKAVGLAVWMHQPYCRVRPDYQRARLPVTHWSPHDLRRSVRTMLASLGCPDDVAEAVLGHVQPGIKGVYNLHKYDAERLDWLTRLSAALESVAAAV